jgi:hypothetical protein
MKAPLLNPGGIPDELKALRRWVPMKPPVWTDSAGKVPEGPHREVDRSMTWRTFDGSFMLFVIGGGYSHAIIDSQTQLRPFLFVDVVITRLVHLAGAYLLTIGCLLL